MSLLQASVYAHSIVVAADTATEWRTIEPQSERRGLTSTSKLVAIPHMPGVLAGRGNTVLIQMLMGQMAMQPTLERFIETAPETAAQATALLRSANPDIGGQCDPQGEAIVAGWSQRAGRLMAFHGAKPEGGRFTFEEIHGEAWAPLPYADDTTALKPQTVDDRVRLARLQAERILADPNNVAGGDLTIATLTRDAVSVEVVRGFTGEAAGTAETGETALAGV